MKSEKKISWQRWLLAVASIIAIIVMWTRKNVAGQFAGMSAADALPMIVINVAVTGAKVAVMAGVLLLARRIAAKLRK